MPAAPPATARPNAASKAAAAAVIVLRNRRVAGRARSLMSAHLQVLRCPHPRVSVVGVIAVTIGRGREGVQASSGQAAAACAKPSARVESYMAQVAGRPAFL